VKRAPFVVALAIVAAPPPGETGGCAAEAFIADAVVFCVEVESWECRRRERRGEITNVQACVDETVETCNGSAWPASCLPPPTERYVGLCIDALSLVRNVDVSLTEIPECQLCPPLGSGP
jgi:hypothetical protein